MIKRNFSFIAKSTLLALLLTHASVSLANPNQVHLNQDKIKLSELVKIIRKQTGYNILYSSQSLSDNKIIDVRLQNLTIPEVMNNILADSKLSYTIKDKTILIQPNTDSSEQVNTVKGKIVGTDGMPLQGATVTLQRTNVSTKTNEEGEFLMENLAVGDIITVRFVGYKTIAYKITDLKNVQIQLAAEDQALETVVVTALGIKRSDKSLSYNVQQIAGEEVDRVKDANFVNSLSGKIAGATINGSPSGIGGATKVVLRGAKSISGNNNALYVIDGIPLSNNSLGNHKEDQSLYADQPAGGETIGDLNSDDIESINVLTGQAAAALYGSAGANGAILITTKRGAVGKVKIGLGNQTTFMNPLMMPKLQNTYGNEPNEYSSWGEKLKTPSSYDPKNFFNTGYNSNSSLTFSVGSEKSQTYISTSANNAAGILPNNKYNRYNFNVRNTTNFLNDKMLLDLSGNYILQDNQNMTSQGVYFNPLLPLYSFPAGENFEDVRLFEEFNELRNIHVQRWKWGDQGLNFQNPYWITNRNMFNTDKKRYIFTASLKYDVLDWLSLSTRVRADNSNFEIQKKIYATTLKLFADDNGRYYNERVDENQFYGDFMASINKSYADFGIRANLGTSIQKYSYQSTGLDGNLGIYPNFFSIKNITKESSRFVPIHEDMRDETQAVFGSAELSYKNSLFLNLTGRNDWLSQQSNTSKKSTFYPSIGLSAVLSDFITLPEVWSYWKLRGSYVEVGLPIPRNISEATTRYDPSSGLFFQTDYKPITDLVPERTKTYEVGADFRFFENALSLTASLYKSNTYNQTLLMPYPPSQEGYKYQYVQTGNIENKGLELTLGYRLGSAEAFQWNSSFNVGINRNKIIDLGNYMYDGTLSKIEDIQKTQIGNAMIFLQEGGTLGDLWSTRRLARDENGNVLVNPSSGQLGSESFNQKMGSVFPDANLGFNNNFSYKNFSLGVVFTARLGGKTISYTQAILDGFGVTQATADARDDGGIPINNGTIDAKTYYSVVGGTNAIMSNYVYDATNVRLQELSFGYTIPKAFLKNVASAKLALVGRNLWMIYNKSPFDPELAGSTGNYYQGFDYFMLPSLRNIGFSVKVDF